MNGIELLKIALQEQVEILPKNFVSDNNIKVKYIGERFNPINASDLVKVYVIEEEGELNGKVVYQY
jgi:hypothetical protein